MSSAYTWPPAGMRPMREFDPAKRAILHDSLNDVEFEWLPRRAESWGINARKHDTGVVEWDGLLLDGGGRRNETAPGAMLMAPRCCL